MKTEIISTGTELLLGQILDTNAQYLSAQLSVLGIEVDYHTTVGDNPERLENVLRQAWQRADLIVTTGGLGPTADDLTKETAAKVLGLEMVLDDKSLKGIRHFFADRKSEMPASNLKQAYFPKGARIFPNELGTAPGAMVTKDNKTFIILPGRPFEMQPMFEQYVLLELEKHIVQGKKRMRTRILRVFGIGESALEEVLGELLSQDNPVVALIALRTEINIQLTACDADEEVAVKILDTAEQAIRSRLGYKVFARDEETMAAVVGQALRNRGYTLATAESCTGGLVGATLTHEAGISDCYLGGVISYANSVKESVLGVKRSTLQSVGAVSRETAEQMAEGVRRLTGADLAISITGLAGPGGETETKPIGLVYIGLASLKGTEVRKFQFHGGRDSIRQLTVMAALNMVRCHMLEF
jgi:nicotinamide-nucleotide amidase